MNDCQLHVGAARLVVVGMIVFASGGNAQAPSPLARVEALGLETSKIGPVTAYFAPDDRERAVELAKLSVAAAAFFERELGISFQYCVAALGPEHWFSEFPGVPYAIPWTSIPERLIFVPASLEEGLLIRGPTELHDRRRVDFVLLHELAHLAAKELFRPASDLDYMPVAWFEELLANYFAYAYVRSTDLEWAEAGREMWADVVESSTPPVFSLDWSFMNILPPNELARTYAWYQNLLNVRAAALYEEHGLAFLRTLKDQLPWDEVEDWTDESLRPALKRIDPDLGAWVENFETDHERPRDGAKAPGL